MPMNIVVAVLCLGLCGSVLAISANAASPAYPLPTVDLSDDSARHVIISQGTEVVYQGHPTTVLLPDGKTMYCVWTYEHGGACGPLKRSDDGGRTWSELLDVPESWRSVNNCPTIYRLADPAGINRLVVYADGPTGLAAVKGQSEMYRAYSEDDGRTWNEMASTKLVSGVMPFCSIVPVR